MEYRHEYPNPGLLAQLDQNTKEFEEFINDAITLRYVAWGVMAEDDQSPVWWAGIDQEKVLLDELSPEALPYLFKFMIHKLAMMLMADLPDDVKELVAKHVAGIINASR